MTAQIIQSPQMFSEKDSMEVLVRLTMEKFAHDGTHLTLEEALKMQAVAWQRVQNAFRQLPDVGVSERT
ncbi:MAG: hypothetical protein LCH70_07625 [Proteobacteria bacterium]|nr:hypothetical protein [Pseudomonadota bacterium]